VKFVVAVAASLPLLFVATAAHAGTVKSVTKKIVVVTLDEGETREVDDELCFFTKSGKQVACGAVTKISKKAGTITLRIESALDAKKVKKGMAVGPEGEAPEPASKAGGAKGGGYKGKKSPFRVWGLFNPAIATPAVYKKISYLAPASEPADTLWSADADVKSAIMGFGLQVGIPMGSFSLNPGFRYRSYTGSVVDADYVPQRENPYASVEQSATALGFWLDFQYYRMPMGSIMWLNMTSGLDADMSTVNVKAQKIDDDAGTESSIVDATSKLTVLSLRFGAGLDILFTKSFGMQAGLNLIVPVAEFGKAFSGSFADDEGRGLSDPGADLEAALAHKKGGVGIDATLGLVLAF
jgi:hypothetical protein